MKTDCQNLGGPAGQTYWENVATTRWGMYTTEVARRSILHAHGLFPKPGEAFEVGCEGGRWSKMLSDLGWSLSCADVDSQALALCQSRNPNARCILVNPADTVLPMPGSSIDFFLCAEVFPVIESDWFLSEARRILRPGGRLVGVYLNMRSARGLLARYVTEPRKNPDGFRHYRFAYSPFRRNLVGAGFEIEREEGYCWGPFSRESNSPMIPAFLQIERMLRLSRIPSLSPWIAFVARYRG